VSWSAERRPLSRRAIQQARFRRCARDVRRESRAEHPPSADVDAVLLHRLTVLDGHAQKMPSLVERYIAHASSPSRPVEQFAAWVEEMLHEQSIRPFAREFYAAPGDDAAVGAGDRPGRLDCHLERSGVSPLAAR
jgi:hypothetical protein